ncbi:23S rRNA (uracil(1939)-C(5))-methyltransferase RlmD [Gemella sp. GH3]|uniref:23S rRNA (uracil(1939)-C(5))-methyltransferase RlmD n=1 Tax=unclassified Gemella TaxID=2624949 RepID=UPI0015D01B0D|nr:MULTISPECIES: 23S rRNA (uracil(1939)-C(5))-methyltransferase RlmD [unclassified Gemella]MBF0714158.1 23S rRNA (uracil(1939)-C(5))-methyltransferase RlmD [Gemella sp. GH3.1]NYS51110.1 23S rRNA (uracil(1939)-C(5))-methyltransferase RlmD [Gemella sp. GH3]
MQKNDYFIGIVTDYTHDGLGVVKINNFPLFVEDVVVGEEVEIKVTKLKKNLGYAKLIKIIKKSPNRVEITEKTSGANLLHLSYEEQLKFKTNKVKNIFDKILGKDQVNVLQTLGMENPYNYRNKSVVPVQKENEEIKMGYYKPRTHDVINSYNCSIQYEEHNILINKIRDIIKNIQLSVYDEKNHKGALRHIMFRTNRDKTEIMIGIIAKEKFAKLKEFVNEMVSLDNRIKSIILNINDKKTNVIYGDYTEILYGEEFISDYLGNLKFNISLKSFYQVNPIQTELLYRKAIELADVKQTDNVIDAYCGIGTISLFVAGNAKKVYGIEVVEPAINNAVENARNNDIDNVKFLLGKSEEVIEDLIQNKEKIDVVIVDPPRKGCEESFLRNLSDMNIPKVVYVSCNPATLARDINIMKNLGYNVGDIQPVDMFPQTVHVECVVLLQRSKE